MLVKKRLEKLRDILSSENVDAILISDEKSIFYFTNFFGGFKLLVPSNGEATLFVHSVNYEAAKEFAKNVGIMLIKVGEDPSIRVLEEIVNCNIKSLGFDKMGAFEYLEISEKLKNVNLKPLENAVWSLRKVKDEYEIALMRKAAELTSRGMEKAAEIIEAGLKEYEVAAEVEYEIRKLGSNGVAFDTIVCSGPSSAFPHGGWGDREIKNGDFVIIDIGAKYRGYCADLTRTFIVGKPSEKQIRIYKLVTEVQRNAINRIRSGVKAGEVDAAAREHIANMGYGEYFVHGLGHGVGLDVHEPPRLTVSSKDILVSGNIVTVEPGIYIPKYGGVRIEDIILVREENAIKLTEASTPCY